MTSSLESMPAVVAETTRGVSVDVCFDLDAARPQWAAMEDPALPFQTLAWLDPWYRIVAPAFRARPVFVTVRDSSGRPLLFFPMCLRRWRGLRVIEFADLCVSDYNGPIVAKGFAPTPDELNVIWRRVLRALPPSDLVRLEKIPESIFGRANVFAHLRGLQQMSESAWMLDLPDAARNDEDMISSAKARKEIRRKTRRLKEKVGDLVLERACAGRVAEEALEALRRQRAARFGSGNLLEHPHFSAFYREVISCNAHDFVELWAFKTGDRIVATHFALRGPRAYLLIMHGFDATIDCGAIGIVAIDQMIRRRIELGDRYFDFTIGDESYKRQFGVRQVRLFKALHPTSPLGRAFVFAHPAARRVLAALRG